MCVCVCVCVCVWRMRKRCWNYIQGYEPQGYARPGHKMQMRFNKIPPGPAYLAFA